MKLRKHIDFKEKNHFYYLKPKKKLVIKIKYI